MNNNVTTKTIEEAAKKLEGIVHRTPLQLSKRLSSLYKAKIYVKREDLQEVRSYKIRGAYNLMSSLTEGEKNKGVVCASAGNHAQGVAQSACLLKIKATIFMPSTTPLQKINRVKEFGREWITVKLTGQTFDEACYQAEEFCKKEKMVFVHAFDDYRIINGQGTVGKEIFDKLGEKVDFILCPIGGGGLISGVGTYLKEKNKKIKVIGVEPQGAAGMFNSVKNKKVTTLGDIDTFVDGAAIKTVGDRTFEIASKIINDIILIPEGKVCITMIELYQNEGIVAEPAGALTLSALDYIKKDIVGKTVVCVLSGGNNDILRYPEIMEKSLVFQGLKHYFLINFAQKPGQLRKFVDKALSPNDDIVRFEYIKKTSKETGPALVGIELSHKEDLKRLLNNMDKLGINYTRVPNTDLLFKYLI